jgi:hypothetical protein
MTFSSYNNQTQKMGPSSYNSQQQYISTSRDQIFGFLIAGRKHN